MSMHLLTRARALISNKFNMYSTALSENKGDVKYPMSYLDESVLRCKMRPVDATAISE